MWQLPHLLKFPARPHYMRVFTAAAINVELFCTLPFPPFLSVAVIAAACFHHCPGAEVLPKPGYDCRCFSGPACLWPPQAAASGSSTGKHRGGQAGAPAGGRGPRRMASTPSLPGRSPQSTGSHGSWHSCSPARSSYHF